jgi:hypothetical protein
MQEQYLLGRYLAFGQGGILIAQFGFQGFFDREGRVGKSGQTLKRGCSSVGRAVALQAKGQEFDSPQLHQ